MLTHFCCSLFVILIKPILNTTQHNCVLTAVKIYHVYKLIHISEHTKIISSFNSSFNASSCLKGKIHYPFKLIQLKEWHNYLNMNSCLHLSNKLKEHSKLLWIHLWNHYFISMKEFVFSKVAGYKPATSLNWTPS